MALLIGIGSAALASLFLAGCVQPPAALRGSHEAVTVRDAQSKPATGARVRWGGKIAAVSTRAEETCFEIVSHPLDAAARPRETDETEGRFVACAAGFFDPAIYEVGREVTVVGTLTESVDGKIGERPYRFPRLAAEHVHLWPKREPTVIYRPVYDPFWYPYWWGPRYRRGWWP